MRVHIGGSCRGHKERAADPALLCIKETVDLKAAVCARGRGREREQEREREHPHTHTHTQYVCKYGMVLVLFFLC